ncbi:MULTISPECIES: hypothetical protein [unclassified Variovorax]|jgi:hypothetical protein|uniref:hypothetical protein n=1 Tax=unclassified Variovorax TaxID=663243 RepID=UPI0008E55934|nr:MULTISPECIES: hypothetical protein [unclassified Variovorax]TAJ55991.1 MAG: hypothetical protein EPO53_41180 [Variovorax sp.]SFQ15138.1 hypothetical protein SAMN05443579_12519 [Variovorax sp. PDC80]
MSLKDLLGLVVSRYAHAHNVSSGSTTREPEKIPRAPVFVEKAEDREEANKRMRDANRSHANVHLDMD